MSKINQDLVTQKTQSMEATSPFLLPAQFLLSLCFLALSDAIWLDTGVLPSGPSKISSDSALPAGLGQQQDRAVPILYNQILWAA